MADNIGVYEGLFILDANRYARDHDKVSKEISDLIDAAGGVIEVSRLWEERRLAYPIRGQRKGAYWLAYFRIPTGKIDELSRACEINDTILRQLFVRLPQQLVAPILAHAKGETTEETPEEEAPAETVTAGA